MNNGLIIIISIFILVHLFVLIGFFVNKHKLKKIALFTIDMIFELVFELGKTLLVTGVVGIYFIPDTKDFTKAIASGIIFFMIGYIARKKEQK